MKLEYEVQLVATTTQLQTFQTQMESLAQEALEPNPFFESWMLLPALEAIGCDAVVFALIWKNSITNTKAEPALVGFFPLTLSRSLKVFPIKVANILQHVYSFLGIPLVHRQFARESLESFFQWLNTPQAPATVIRFACLPVGGAFHQLLSDVVAARSLLTFTDRHYSRALQIPSPQPEAYLAESLSGKARKHFRRQRRLLEDMGTVEYTLLGSDGDVAVWTDEFLQLEASGWKGREGTALASAATHRKYFEAVAAQAFGRGRLLMSALRLNGRMIAARTVFRAGEGSYLFKIAFDEKYAKLSPGMLLEMDCLVRSRWGEDAWTDSCTSSTNQVYKRIWKDRRTIEDLLVSGGGFRGDLAISLLPLMRFGSREWQRLKARWKPGSVPPRGQADREPEESTGE